MAPRNKKTKKTRGQKRGVTRKVANGKVLDVRSPKDVKAFERLVVNGPLTLVYINAKWCGACHQFTDKVWNHIVSMKNKKMNVASVDSEMVGKIPSLANVPRKFYPTLMLVGEDKKPATFLDEDGNPTAAMPRNASLEEDKEAFSSLVQNPTLANTGSSEMANTTRTTSASPEMANNTRSTSASPEMANNTRSTSASPEMTPSLPPEAIASQPIATMKSKSNSAKSNSRTMNSMLNSSKSNSAKSNSRTMNSMLNSSRSNSAKSNSRTMNSTKSNSRMSTSPMSEPIRLRQLSPFPNTSKVPSMLESKGPIAPRVPVPNVASDILSSSHMRNMSAATNPPVKGGKLLNAINAHTASLKALLKLRNKNLH